MLQFKKYLEEIKKDYTSEEIIAYKNQIAENNEKIISIQDQIFALENKKQNLLKENLKIENIFLD